MTMIFLPLIAAMSMAQTPVAPPAAPLGGIADAGKGRVIFFRRARHTDSYFSGPCRISEQTPTAIVPTAQIKGNRYASTLVEPGVHQYHTKQERSDRLTLEVEAGETYFVECAMTSGWVASNPDLKPSTETIFREYLPHLKPQ